MKCEWLAPWAERWPRGEKRRDGGAWQKAQSKKAEGKASGICAKEKKNKAKGPRN